MRTVQSRIALVALAAALLCPAALWAQRKVIAPPGSKPASTATDDKKAEPAKAPDAGPEEAAPAPAAKPVEPTPAAKPAPAAEPAPDAGPSRGPVGPVAKDQPKKEPPPSQMLVPKDEQDAPKREVKSTTTTSKADEAVYRRKIDKMSVTLRVQPAKPVPGRAVTLTFEIVKILTVPDPTLGDHLPLENALLLATVGKDGAGAPARYRLHALTDAGIYGTHFTASEAGLYRVGLEQRLVNAEIGDKALATDFVVGIGQDTPMPAATEEESAVKAGRGRTALKTNDGLSTEGAAALMRALGDQWLALAESLANPAATGDKVAAARALAEAEAKLAGQVPASMNGSRREFDTLATDLQAALKDLTAAVGAGADKGSAAMARIETEQCARCHVKFRYQIAEDVSGWPKFTPKAPREKEAGPRKPLQH